MQETVGEIRVYFDKKITPLVRLSPRPRQKKMRTADKSPGVETSK